MEEFKSWEDLSDLEKAQSAFWDMYKDAHGIRPRGIDTSAWTLAEFEQEFTYLGKLITEQETARIEAEHMATVRFERRLLDLVTTGARDRNTAIRWVHEAEGTNGDNDYLAWTLGLPYRYFAVDKVAV